jgi:hypothetical protein
MRPQCLKKKKKKYWLHLKRTKYVFPLSLFVGLIRWDIENCNALLRAESALNEVEGRKKRKVTILPPLSFQLPGYPVSSVVFGHNFDKLSFCSETLESLGRSLGNKTKL